MKTVSVKGVTNRDMVQNPIHFEISGAKDTPVILWAHGWGQNLGNFKPMASSLENAGKHVLVDLPGFGQSPPPPEGWGTDQYADALAAFIRENGFTKVIWVGHSFGCRVGLQIAARHPDLIAGMFLIAAAGLKRKRPPHKTVYLKARIYTFKFLKKLIPLGIMQEEWLKQKFGASDYRNTSGTMRAVIVKTVNEDLSDVAAKVKCPVILVYGSEDTETPPEIGKRLHKLIPHSEYIEMEGQDHYTVLSSGRHPVTRLLKEFIDRHG